MPASSLRIVVLSSGDLGAAVANRLVGLQEVERVSLLVAPFSRSRRGLLGTIGRSIKYEGLTHTVAAGVRRLFSRSRSRSDVGDSIAGSVHSDVDFRWCSAFESDDALRHLRSYGADLGVVAGTYILPPEVFALPEYGSINLHSGKVPEYRGSAPGFWEHYHAEEEVGITVHVVTEQLDAGDILGTLTVPLDPAPSIDPLQYLEEYRREVLRPRGIQLLSFVVQRLARGSVQPEPQDPERANTFPKPTMREKRELRLKVERRLREGEA